jgi:putative ABC transport system substrate-binding protein
MRRRVEPHLMELEPDRGRLCTADGRDRTHVWQTKYRYKEDSHLRDETIEDTWRRVARVIAAVEPHDREWWQNKFFEILKGCKFLPGGRILAGAGTGRRVSSTPEKRDPSKRPRCIVAAFRQGLKEQGYVEGQNVAIESRFAEGQVDRLQAMASDLVRHGVSVFVATGGAASVVKARPVVPHTIPIVFAMGGDPVKLGIVASLARPSDNITGVAFLLSELAQKQVELLHELVAKAAVIGFLVDPTDPVTESDTKNAQAAANTLGHELVIVKASRADEIAPAIAILAQQQIKALFVNAHPLFNVNFPQIRELAARYGMATISSWEGFAAEGGLISYGTSINEANRLVGVYTGRVLKGEKPADLPVQQSTRFQLIVNLKTAKALGLTIPPAILARADEVIE